MSESESVVDLLKPLMIFTGIWKPNIKNSKAYWWYTRLFHGLFMAFGSLLILKLLQLIWIDSNYEVIYSSLGIVLTCIAVWIKIWILQINRVPEMLQVIVNEERKIWMSMNEDFISHYQTKIKYSRKWIWGITVNAMSLVISLVAASLLNLFVSDQSATKSKKDEIQEWIMYPMWWPFVERNHTILVLVLDTVYMVIGTALFAVSHMMIATLLIYAVAQLEMLHIRINQLDLSTFGATGKVCRSLKNIAFTQNELSKFSKNLNNAIKYVVLLEFLVNSFNVASVATQFANVQTGGDFLFILCYFIVLVMQVFALGWLANEIKVQSLKTADVLCGLNWYNLNLHDRKLLCFMIMRSQRSLMISIGPFGMITTETAFSIMKAAYSYLMLMQNYSQ